MLSKIQIWNMAVKRVCAEYVVTDATTSDETALCETHYDHCVNLVLRSHPWNCAMARTELPQLSAAPAFGWKYAYQLPPDCLRVVGMSNPSALFAVESTRLLTDEAKALIRYVRRPENPAELSVDVVECIVLQLSARIAPALVNNPQAGRIFLDEYEQIALPAAKVANAYEVMEHTPRPGWLADI